MPERSQTDDRFFWFFNVRNQEHGIYATKGKIEENATRTPGNGNDISQQKLNIYSHRKKLLFTAVASFKKTCVRQNLNIFIIPNLTQKSKRKR